MSAGQPAIVNLASVAKSDIAALHLRYLVSPFSGRPGRKLLELYYDTFARTKDAFGLVAVIDGQVAGYACVMRDTRAIQLAVLRRAPLRLVWWGLVQLLARPRLLAGVMGRLQGREERIHWQRPQEMREWWPYRPLIVAEPYRRHGVADLLMQAVFEEARRRGIPGLIGTSERANAQSRINLVRNGYQEVWRNDDYVVFVKPVAPRQDAESDEARGSNGPQPRARDSRA
jgi:GNAT superfamily N-acetyltransferase